MDIETQTLGARFEYLDAEGKAGELMLGKLAGQVLRDYYSFLSLLT